MTSLILILSQSSWSHRIA